MKKESADKKKTRRSPRLSREQKRDTTPSPGTAKDGPTRRAKRKASPEQKTTRKRAKKPAEEEEDLRIRVLKRKVRDDGEGAAKTAKRRRRLDPNQDGSVSSSVDTEGSSGKRKATDHTGEGPSSKRTRTPDQKDDRQEEDQDRQEKDQAGQDRDQDHQKMVHEDATAGSPGAEFEAKYEQQDQLGEGGCGCVFAGFRKADHLPVAIKHIPKEKSLGKHLDNEGRQVSVEVSIMLRLGAGTSGSAGAPVSLLDWYDLGPKLILVMERPVPCVDLFDYVGNKGGSLQEKEAKIILKQLVSAAKELEDRQIFHRDIKRENILIETSSEVPRVRLIDFGLGCFTKKKSLFRNFYGTRAHVPPEWYVNNSYRAGPTTVWQVGVVLFDTLHRKVKFETTMFAADKLLINRRLSKDCRDFLQTCLNLDPKLRPTLEQLQQHPWLR